MIERILVPLDGSKRAESAIRPALSLLKKREGSLLLLHALAPASPFPAQERRRAVAYLNAAAARHRRRGVRIETRVVTDDPARAVAQAARRAETELIVLAGRATGALGSVARRLLRRSEVPMLLFRGPAPRGFAVRRLLVALDAAGRTRRALPVVGELAESLGARVSLLHLGRRRSAGLTHAVDLLARLEIPFRILFRPGGASGREISRACERTGADVVVLPAESPAAGDRPLLLACGA